MRITKTQPTPDQEKEIDAVWKAFHAKWPHIPKDVITDLWATMEDPEGFYRHRKIMKEVGKLYRSGEVEYMSVSYERFLKWRKFLKQFTKHPWYRELIQDRDRLMKIADVLGNIIDKMPPGAFGGGSGSGGQSREEYEFMNLINFGKNILELLEDQSIQQALQPGSIPQNQQQQGGQQQGQQKQPGGKGFDYSQGMGQMLKFDPVKIQIFNLANSFNYEMRMRKGGKERPSVNPDDGMNIRNIRTNREILQLLPGELCLPGDIFYPKLSRKELLIKEYTTKSLDKQVLYILLDGSGSMQDYLDNQMKYIWASSVAIAYLRRVLKNKDVFALSFFASNNYGYQLVESPEQAGKAINSIMNEGFNGGGTRLQEAIEYASNKIKAERGHTEARAIGKADILVISDGESYVDINKVREYLGKDIKLQMVTIGHGDSSGLKEIAETYLEIQSEEGFHKLAAMYNK